METLKNVLAVLAAIVGALTGLLTLYAKYLDVKKSAAHERDDADAAMAVVRPEHNNPYAPPDAPIDPFSDNFAPRRDVYTLARAKKMVKAPAISLMVAGAISLFFNLFMTGFGYVDRYVMPITTESQERQALIKAEGRGDFQVSGRMPSSPSGTSDDFNAVAAIYMLSGLSLASAASIWAGYGMLRLRGYWFSVAGSVTIMAGASLSCCMAGFPIGIWSLVILFKPEVSSSFR